MNFAHAAVWMDHHHALVAGFDGEHHESRKLQAPVHATRQHGSDVRSGHEYFSQLCDALASFEWILMTGSHIALADLRRYVDTHRPTLPPRIAGWETVDHPTSAQLLALARHRRHEATHGVAGRS